MEPKIEHKDENPIIQPEKEEDKDELSENDLDNVTGGKVALQDFHFTKKVDKSSSKLS